MSFWGRLFGSDKATEKLIDNVSSGLDKLYYSDEEKAQDAAAARTEGRQVLIEWLKGTQGQNLSRRLIALSITFVWLFMHLVAMSLDVTSVWVDSHETMVNLNRSSGFIYDAAADMAPAVMLILGFYFAAPHMGRIAEAALIKFGERNTKDA